MRSPLIVAALGLLFLADVAQAQTLKATSNIVVRASARTIDFTSDTTTSIRDSKIVREAHDDAASFVATNGEEHGWSRRWITCAEPNQNFMSATLNWRRQFSSNNHLCISLFVTGVIPCVAR